ncbi:XdhC family protein [Spongiimicrobium sp. 3-5]|uniref:XdhC family protein n=1 Tax=Spongiimicrobium sp. 3-5 TaxID=3332596 RepID=UPI00397EA320
MTHELKKIIQSYNSARQKNLGAVLATVVALDGSSYRRPGVRMLIFENGSMVGAVSGGCVEKEVLRQAEQVFKTNIPKIMTYDGRYRLGCEGILYILIEPFRPNTLFLEAFDKAIEDRAAFKVISLFKKADGSDEAFGSVFQFGDQKIPLRKGNKVHLDKPKADILCFEELMAPCLRLIIFGAEHDAVQLCSFASLNGWEVTIIATPSEEKSVRNFPGAQDLVSKTAEELDLNFIDPQTAVILMSHSYVKDLKYLIALKDQKPFYLGMLGPYKRREKLFNEFLDHCPEVSDSFLDRIHGPAGLNIGAETPQEIAIAILSEILSVKRQKEPMMLKDKEGGIHN